MLPTIPAARIFPSSCETYTSHLGEHQARAFTELWQIHSAPDRVTSADRAASEVHQQLRTRDGVRIIPPDLARELFDGLRRMEAAYPQGASAADIEYAGLFLAIATWQHEILPGNIDSFADGATE